MQNEKPDIETLNAYVDGELDKEDAAFVASAAAHDPIVARKIATLANLRSTLSETFIAPEPTISELVSRIEEKPTERDDRSGKSTWMAIAACLAGLLITGVFLYTNEDAQPGFITWASPVLEAHNLWELPGNGEEPVSLKSVNFLSNELAKLVYVPDLSSARLNMVYVKPDHYAGGVNLFVAGYAGTRGCKITLVARKALGVLDENMRDIGKPDLRALAWNAGPLDYILMSQGMDNDRFELIASTVRKSSLSHQPIESQTRIALGISRELSTPCTA